MILLLSSRSPHSSVHNTRPYLAFFFSPHAHPIHLSTTPGLTWHSSSLLTLTPFICRQHQALLGILLLSSRSPHSSVNNTRPYLAFFFSPHAHPIHLSTTPGLTWHSSSHLTLTPFICGQHQALLGILLLTSRSPHSSVDNTRPYLAFFFSPHAHSIHLSTTPGLTWHSSSRLTLTPFICQQHQALLGILLLASRSPHSSVNTTMPYLAFFFSPHAHPIHLSTTPLGLTWHSSSLLTLTPFICQQHQALLGILLLSSRSPHSSVDNTRPYLAFFFSPHAHPIHLWTTPGLTWHSSSLLTLTPFICGQHQALLVILLLSSRSPHSSVDNTRPYLAFFFSPHAHPIHLSTTPPGLTWHSSSLLTLTPIICQQHQALLGILLLSSRSPHSSVDNTRPYL